MIKIFHCSFFQLCKIVFNCCQFLYQLPTSINTNKPLVFLCPYNIMQNENIGKKIQKYKVTQIMQSRPNGVTLMRAIHTETGEHFIIKKANFDGGSGVTLENLSGASTAFDQPGLLSNQVASIKDMNIPRILKCRQMIKTKRSLYFVYENYPELSLEKYMKQRGPVPALKIRFAKIICETLQQIHRKGYVYVNLTPASIYVIPATNLNPNSYQLRFVGFQFATKVTEQSPRIQVPLQLLQTNIYIAPQVLNQGYACTKSDIYSAGKIFELLGLLQIKGKIENKPGNEAIMQMIESDVEKRSPLNKVWSCLKMKQNEAKLFDHPVVELQVPTANRKNLQTISNSNKQREAYLKSPIEKRNAEDEQRRLRKIMKIRTLGIYLVDLANFALSQKHKTLFYLLIKKSAIVRSNLIHELKKMLAQPTGEQMSKLNLVKNTLSEEQDQLLNILASAEQILSSENNKSIQAQLQNRNQLNEGLMQDLIYEFLCRKRKEVKPFHTILQQKQRTKLAYLVSLSEKLNYGSFEKFFEEVITDTQTNMAKQKYFTYLRSTSTKEILQRLDKTLEADRKAK